MSEEALGRAADDGGAAETDKGAKGGGLPGAKGSVDLPWGVVMFRGVCACACAVCLRRRVGAVGVCWRLEMLCRAVFGWSGHCGLCG